MNNENKKITTTEISVGDTKEEFLDITEKPSSPPTALDTALEETCTPIDNDEESEEIDNEV